MIKKSIDRAFMEAMYPIDTSKLIKDAMEKEAIKDDGIYSMFKFNNEHFPTGIIKITLRYCKFDGDGCSWMPIHKTIFYIDCPELGNVTLSSICPETLQKVIDRIKLDLAKKYNAIWSTIKVEPCHGHFDVSYEKVYATRNDEVDTSKWKPAAANAQTMEIENTKRTLQRLERLRMNSYYGLYPRNAMNDAVVKYIEADEKAVKDAFEFRTIFNKEKEKKDMNITLMVVPEGMSNDFVRKVKANYQSNNSLRLFIASTDIDYSCEHEPIKTKYDLFEKWIKTGYVDIVYFMLGFEKDPDVRAFEAFVRGITEFSGKVDVRVAYQRDDILNDANNLRTAYFDEADSKEDLEKAGNKVVKEAKTMRDIYGLDDEGLEDIKNSTGRIDASDELVMGKIMDAAFAEDEDAKPAKKGGKK